MDGRADTGSTNLAAAVSGPGGVRVEADSALDRGHNPE